MLKIGFTGSRVGMTPAQRDSLGDLLLKLTICDEFVQFHHGDSVGADDQAANIVKQMIKKAYIVAHPGLSMINRAYNKASNGIRAAKSNLERNIDIVNETNLLIAAPKKPREERRSGTWHTVRYALRKGKGVWVIWPSGLVEEWPRPIVKSIIRVCMHGTPLNETCAGCGS